MFAINDHVFYGTTGVCRIVDVRTERLGGSEAQEYFVLKPVFNPGSTVYISVSDEDLLSKMRPIMTKDEVHRMIATMPVEDDVWIRDDRERDRDFGTRIRSGDTHELVRIIKSIYSEKERKKEEGKKLNAMDTRIMATAEKLLHEEFALVLGIAPKDVVSYISEHIAHR